MSHNFSFDFNNFFDIYVLNYIGQLYNLLSDNFNHSRNLNNFRHQNCMGLLDPFWIVPLISLNSVSLVVIEYPINFINILQIVFVLFYRLFNVILLDSLSGDSSWDSNLLNDFVEFINWSFYMDVSVFFLRYIYHFINIDPFDDFLDLNLNNLSGNSNWNNFFDEFINKSQFFGYDIMEFINPSDCGR